MFTTILIHIHTQRHFYRTLIKSVKVHSYNFFKVKMLNSNYYVDFCKLFYRNLAISLFHCFIKRLFNPLGASKVRAYCSEFTFF